MRVWKDREGAEALRNTGAHTTSAKRYVLTRIICRLRVAYRYQYVTFRPLNGVASSMTLSALPLRIPHHRLGKTFGINNEIIVTMMMMVVIMTTTIRFSGRQLVVNSL